MSIFDDVTPGEEAETVDTAYKLIKERKLETAALLILRAAGLFAPLAGAMGRFFLGPVTPFMGHREEKWIWTLEKTENVNKLIAMLEADEEKEAEPCLETTPPAS
ncbi:MAG: hypothetical protein Q8O47_09120 [Candidatus Bathyarchaeota archaeon]|nr:hypothetical protein [Candidatus Bathyarchaeota archaeon]